MEELKNLTSSTLISRISVCLHKIYKKIIEQREKNIPEHNIKEIELLKNYCKTDNVQLCLMCCQTLVKLVEIGALDLTSVLNFLITLLPNSNFGQYTTITEGVLNLLLLSLKRNAAQLKPNENYECPYGMRSLQHPLITLIQNTSSNINDIANKITGICNHHDEQIRKYSIEFLRPVCLYIFCSLQTIPDSKVIWTNLLTLSKSSSEAGNLIREIITWSKINSQDTCLFTSILLIETIEHYQNSNDIRQSSELILYLCLIINHLIEYGINPRSCLNCVLRFLYNIDSSSSSLPSIKHFYNIILVILSQTLHIICPVYLSDLYRIFEFIIINKNYGNQYILNMILDGTMQWMARQTFISNDGLKLADNIIQKIIEMNDNRITNITTNVTDDNKNPSSEIADIENQLDDNKTIDEKSVSTSIPPPPESSQSLLPPESSERTDLSMKTSTTIPINKIELTETNEYNSNVRYLHPDIALAFDIAILSDSFEYEYEFKNVFTFIDSLNFKTKTYFCNRIQLFLRALFLSKDPSLDCWFKIYQILLSILKSNELIAYDFLMTYIFKLANETHPEIQLELLRGLPNFAVSKDCIPMILNTIKTLSNGVLTTLSMDLYLRLWKSEIRTYPFLQKVLTQNILSWEFLIAKAYTIREICLSRPTQYYLDLVPLISDILNICSKEDDDLAISIALESILILCENNVINIASTWKELSGKFRHEKRHKSLQSLYKFFGTVPLLESPTKEYYQLVDEALEQLWSVIASSNDSILIRSALKSLSNFDIERKMTIKHIPDKFKYEDHNEVIMPYRTSGVSSSSQYNEQQEHIPGNVWVLLLQRIKPDCIENAADLIAHYIEEEISSYRSGVYRLPDGVPEPRKLTQLFNKSPLKAITDFLVTQSRYNENFNQQQALIITNALRSISKKFSKPIPPLDWCFLHSFFHINFLTRKYCILIAKNQILHSGTAKRFIENILIGFEPNIFEEDLLLLFDILPDLINGVSLHVLKAFIDKVGNYCYRESQLSGFQEGCLFEKFLDSLKYVCINKCSYPEVLLIFAAIAGRYMDSMDLDTKLFQKYTEFVGTLDTQSIDDLTSPINWQEIQIDKLKKSTLIRCYLVLYNTNLYNPLNWLNSIIDAYVTKANEQLFFFRHLSVTLYAFDNDKLSCEWIIELISQIHTLLVDFGKKTQQDNSTKQHDKLLFLLDLFTLSIVLLSGCAILLGNLNIAATSKKLRMELFPESIQILCEHVFWKDNESRIYESLYSMFKNPLIPNDYSEMFKNAIICSRHKQYFDNRSLWTKYVGMRRK